jgi:Flp pilus assembly pilin Flp
MGRRPPCPSLTRINHLFTKTRHGRRTYRGATMMMPILHRFHGDESGAAHEKLALVAAVVTVACLLGAHYLEQMSRSGGLPRIAIISPDGSATTLGGTFAALPSSRQAPAATGSRFGDIDYSATGSLSENLSRSVILDPCTGRSK